MKNETFKYLVLFFLAWIAGNQEDGLDQLCCVLLRLYFGYKITEIIVRNVILLAGSLKLYAGKNENKLKPSVDVTRS